MEEERKKQLWVAEEEKRIRGILDQHRIQEKETVKRFQEMEEKSQDAKKNAIRRRG